MERRDHHHPPTILKDRHIRNPNYLLTQHEASFTSPSSAIPSNNPPVHVPLPETYAHYDPFMPSTLRRRQGSYGREKEATQGRANDELPRTSAWNSTSSGMVEVFLLQTQHPFSFQVIENNDAYC